MSNPPPPPPIGKAFKQTPVTVTPEAVVKFGKGVNDEGGSSASAHPFFSATSIIPGTGVVIFQPGIGVNVNKIVHGGIDIEFGAPVKAGDAIGTTATLLGIDDKGTGKLVNIRFETKNQRDDIVVQGITRYFSRGKSKDGAPAEAKAAPEKFAAELSLNVPTDGEQSRRYAEGSGDRFPIHTDDNFAKNVGLPGVIMHGMCTLALSASALFRKVCGDDWSKLAAVSCKFSHIVLPGDTLTVQARSEGDVWSFQTVTSAGNVAISEGRLLLR